MQRTIRRQIIRICPVFYELFKYGRARKILSDNIKEIITANGMVTITPEQIQASSSRLWVDINGMS